MQEVIMTAFLCSMVASLKTIAKTAKALKRINVNAKQQKRVNSPRKMIAASEQTPNDMDSGKRESIRRPSSNGCVKKAGPRIDDQGRGKNSKKTGAFFE